MIVWIWILVLISVAVLYMRRVYKHFSSHGINHLPVIPPFGNMFKVTSRISHISNVVTEIYNKFPDDRFVGHYEFLNPLVMLRDIELIKQITVKDYDSFLDHRFNIDVDVDPLFGSNLFAMKGQKWRDMRSTLSPAFTSSKIRLMVPFMVEVGNQMIKSLKNKMKQKGSSYLDLDAKDLTTRYTNDVIATCAFGIKVDSMADENNDFYAMGKLASNFTFTQLLKFFGYSSMPKLMSRLKLTMFSDEISNFFTNLVMGTIKNREENNIVRHDMIQILMDAKKGKLSHDNNKTEDESAGFATVEESAVGKSVVRREWSDKELIAQAVIFFLAGFDGVATVMTFLLYELALNPDCQEKLAKEIQETEKQNKGFDYSSVQQMKYLDMVVSEVLRKWSPAVMSDRVAVKSYNLGRPNSKATEDFIIKKGESVVIPVWSIHRDPQYFENPEKFDPERFSDENKHKIQPFTYSPFGSGPRNCIGSRFALCEVKVMVYQIIKDMEIMPCEKTSIPMVLSRSTFNLKDRNGHWLRVKTRNSFV